MEHIAALIANLSHSFATLSIVCLAVSSGIRSAKRRASLARCCQYSGSLTSGAMDMARVLSRTVSGLKVASMTTPQEASLEEEAALLPGRRPQVVIMSVPHKRLCYGMLVGNQSVDLNQKSRGVRMTQKRPVARQSPSAGDVAPGPAIAPVNPLSPANGVGQTREEGSKWTLTGEKKFACWCGF